jgi:5'-nucleotidase
MERGIERLVARARGRHGTWPHVLRVVALTAVVAVAASGCLFYPYETRNVAGSPQPQPWWCSSNVGVQLSSSDCQHLSADLDLDLSFADGYRHASDATAAGATAGSYQPGVGAAFALRPPTAAFNAAQPDTLLYAGADPSSQLAGLEWNVASASAPSGFPGANDVWTQSSPGVWTLHAWLIRPFLNEPDVFAASHPCLGSSGAIFDTTDACFTSTNTQPLEILVSNDDGYNAPGIDAVVQALTAVPGVHVDVVAPATNESGTGNKTTTGTLTAFSGTTISGYPATAVNGYPRDSVDYAIDTLHLNPDLVISGINDGQNIGPVVNGSGTVWAARQGGLDSIPALAASQEDNGSTPPDFASGAAAVLRWLDGFRLGRTGPPFQTVANMNIPTCTSGAIRGDIVLPEATKLNGRTLGPTNCTSTTTTFADDLDGFLNGYVSIADVGTGS